MGFSSNIICALFTPAMNAADMSTKLVSTHANTEDLCYLSD